MSPLATLFTIRAALIPAVLVLSTAHAEAIGLRTKLACAGDYFANCSQFSPDSPQTRRCMRAVGVGLSKACVNALVADGEVTTAEVAKYRALSEQASR